MQADKHRPLSRYLKDFKYTQTHCAYCHKLLDRVTLVHCGEVVNKSVIAHLDTPIDPARWQSIQHEWEALCRFCGELHCKAHDPLFDIVGFKQYLLNNTDMSFGTVREYVVRLRRLGQHLAEQPIPQHQLSKGRLDQVLAPWLPKISTNNYRIALRKYMKFIE